MAADDALRDRRLADREGPPSDSADSIGGRPAPIGEGRDARDHATRQNLEEHLTTTRNLPRLLTLGAVLVFVAAACGTTPGASTAPTSGGGSYEQFAPNADLLAAAKAEGTLTTIALPHDWCNYGETIATFKTRTGLAVNELDPNAGSGDEIEAIKANQSTPGPQAPDVIDVGLAFGPSAKAEGLLENYKVATWDTIPAENKDADGAWYGDYYGVFSFEVNTAVITNVPKDWADLLKDEYKGKVALAGDPRTSSQAILSVFAAGLANGGSLDDATKGLEFFKELNAKGNLVPTIATAATVASGDTPITIRWTYNALSSRDSSAASGGPVIEVVVPTSGRFGGVYVQGISKFAPHPNAAKLWQEFLYSDEGQNIWLKGYCHPIRYADLVANNKVPADQLAKLPDVAGTVFPTLAQLDAARTLITEQWDSVVGLNVE